MEVILGTELQDLFNQTSRRMPRDLESCHTHVRIAIRPRTSFDSGTHAPGSTEHAVVRIVADAAAGRKTLSPQQVRSNCTLYLDDGEKATAANYAGDAQAKSSRVKGNKGHNVCTCASTCDKPAPFVRYCVHDQLEIQQTEQHLVSAQQRIACLFQENTDLARSLLDCGHTADSLPPCGVLDTKAINLHAGIYRNAIVQPPADASMHRNEGAQAHTADCKYAQTHTIKQPEHREAITWCSKVKSRTSTAKKMLKQAAQNVQEWQQQPNVATAPTLDGQERAHDNTAMGLGPGSCDPIMAGVNHKCSSGSVLRAIQMAVMLGLLFGLATATIASPLTVSNTDNPSADPLHLPPDLYGIECMHTFTKQVDRLYQGVSPVMFNKTNSTERLLQLGALVTRVVVPCMEAAEARSINVLVQRAAPKEFMPALLSNISLEYARYKGTTDPLAHNIQISTIFDFNAMYDSVQQFLQHNLSLAATSGFIYGGLTLTDFIQLDAMADLSAFLQADAYIQHEWQDILPFARQQMAMYGGKIVGVPLLGQANYMFWRKDLLEAANLTYPHTWDEMLQVLAVLNGTDMNGDGDPDWALCCPFLGQDMSDDRPCSYSHNMLWSVMSPYLQTYGTTSGMAIDPDNMRILVNTDGGRAAVAVIEAMLPYLHPESRSSCLAYSATFGDGQCAVTFGRFIQFKDSEVGKSSSKLKGRIGVTANMGSLEVLDRESMTLQPCNPTICPASQLTRLMNGTYAYVNYAPFIPTSGMAGAVMSISSIDLQEATFRFLSYAAASNLTMHELMDPTVAYGPVRYSQMDLRPWVAAGYSPHGISMMLDVVRHLLGGQAPGSGSEVTDGVGRNVVVDMGLQHYVTDIMPHLAMLMSSLQQGQISGMQLLQQLEQQWLLWFDKWGLDNVQQQYRSAINWKGYRRLPTPPPPSPPPGRPPAIKPMARIAIITTVGATSCVIASVIVWLLLRWPKRKSLFWHVFAPKAWHGTTLVVVEVQDHPVLHDVLAPDVRDASVHVYQECLRSLLPSHYGYESCQEGDTLILAFHDAEDALRFAAEAQQRLLLAPWPEALLQLPMCRPVYMQQHCMYDPFATWMMEKQHQQQQHQQRQEQQVQQHEPSAFSFCAGLLRGRRISTLQPLPRFDQRLFQRIHRKASPSSSEASCDNTPVSSAEEVRDLEDIVTHREQRQLGQLGHREPPRRTETFFEVCQRAWVVRAEPHLLGGDGEVVLAFRGLGVHIGIHSGVSEDAIIRGATARRIHYTGPTLQLCRLLAECGYQGGVCAGGGTISLSDSTYKLLHMESLWRDIGLLHQGLHVLSEEHPSMNVYQAMDRRLRCRCATAGPIHSLRQLDVGTLAAPVGRVVIAFMNVVGVDTLDSWNGAVCTAALSVFHQVVLPQLHYCRGYQLEAKPNLVLASFFTAEDAVRWSVCTVSLLMQAPWPEELLQHEMGEPVVYHKPNSHVVGGEGALQVAEPVDTKEPPCVLLRGLRVKVGLDQGSVLASVQPITGKLCYRGRVMNRAARISGVAASGQVVCTQAMWNRIAGKEAPVLETGQSLMGTTLGPTRLKGVRQEVELVHVSAAGCCRHHWQHGHHETTHTTGNAAAPAVDRGCFGGSDGASCPAGAVEGIGPNARHSCDEAFAPAVA